MANNIKGVFLGRCKTNSLLCFDLTLRKGIFAAFTVQTEDNLQIVPKIRSLVFVRFLTQHLQDVHTCTQVDHTLRCMMKVLVRVSS